MIVSSELTKVSNKFPFGFKHVTILSISEPGNKRGSPDFKFSGENIKSNTSPTSLKT